jgi:outer membrane protein
MKTIAFLAFLVLMTGALYAQEGPVAAPPEHRASFTLPELVQYALANNPGVKQAEKNVDIERSGVRSAKAERFPQVSVAGGATRYHYPTPVTPISGSPLAGVPFPEFSETIYDLGAYLVLPIYKGGRLVNNVRLSELRQSASMDLLTAARRDLVFNVTSLYYKILQLGRLKVSREAQLGQLEAHRNQVENFFKAGRAARVELLRSEVELAKAKENVLLAENSLKSANEVLRRVIGMEDAKSELSIAETPLAQKVDYSFEQAVDIALKKRPEYQAAIKKVRAGEKRVAMARGRRLPYVYMSGQYVEDASNRLDPKENWMAALRMSVPVFDGGIISAEIEREKAELEKARQTERSLRLEINQEIKESFVNLSNALERIKVAESTRETATENLRVETLKYERGAGTTTDLIDAQANLTGVESSYYQALFDRDVSVVAVRRALGEDLFAEGQSQ